jgi:hypothetical protein
MKRVRPSREMVDSAAEGRRAELSAPQSALRPADAVADESTRISGSARRLACLQSGGRISLAN